jgi:hypothetical protein
MSEIRTDTINNASGDNDSGIDLSTNDQVKIKTANTTRATVDSSGNLLVGTTNSIPGAGNTAVGASIYNDGRIFLSKSANTVASFNRNTSDGAIAEFRKDGTAVGGIGSAASGGQIYIAGSDTGLAFDSGSDLIFPCNSSGSERDNVVDLGYSGGRFDDIFATNGTIQTSDRNEKQDIEELNEAEQRVAVAAKGLMRKFRWIDSVAEKGDNARTHFGIIAQDLQDAFTAEGLDAGDYAMFTSNTWTDDEGNEQTRLGVRYNQLLAFMISAI